MTIYLNKFGRILSSRPLGAEAFNALRPQLDPNDKRIEIDFEGVLSLAPSWADEFFTLLREWSGEEPVFLSSDNASVVATLRILKEMKESQDKKEASVV